MKKIRIKNKLVGDGEPTFIIAEAGINHNGNLNRAKNMVEIAAEIGADAVKFQTGKTSETVTKYAPKANYQKKSTGSTKSQYDMIKKIEFADDQWLELADFAKDVDIIFFSKPPYIGAVDLLIKMGVPVIKIGSGEVTHISLIRRVAQTGLPIILSTGMSTIEEITSAIQPIYKEKNKDLILLHCTSSYPTNYSDVNLRAMITLKNYFKTLVGYSDHTLGITVAIEAVALGACVIEKHFTLNKRLTGPDHSMSLNPSEFRKMVNNIKIAEEALGDSEKKIMKTEQEIRAIARKSIVANTSISKDQIITAKMLGFKRPGTGLPERYLEKIIGKKAKISIKKDEIITLDMI